MTYGLGYAALEGHLEQIRAHVDRDPRHHVALSFEVVRDEVYRARRDEGQAQDRIHTLEVQQAESLRQLKEKDADVARLRAALAPFADLSSIYVRRAETFGYDDKSGIFGATDAEMDRTITVGDCRRAVETMTP